MESIKTFTFNLGVAAVGGLFYGVIIAGFVKLIAILKHSSSEPDFLWAWLIGTLIAYTYVAKD